MWVPLFKADIDVLAHSREKYPVPGLHVNFDEKEQTAHLNDLSMEERLGGRMKRKTTMLVTWCFHLLWRPSREALA